jgi:hypothetical protein
LSITSLELQAKAVADRLDPAEVGFDPITILSLITTILPMLMSCFNRNDEPNESMVKSSFKRYHDSNPDALRRRTMRRVRAEADEPLTKEQAYLIADAVIAQALTVDADTATACAHEAGRDIA